MAYRDIKELLNINRLLYSNNTVDWRPITLLGVNDDVDILTVPEDFTRFNSGTIYFPTTASTLSLVSTSANDTSAGTGARTISIEGLDINWREITETITLNGLTPVTSVNSYLRVNFLEVLSSGTGQKNAGTITATHGATVIKGITINESISRSLSFSIPLGHELFVSSTRFALNRGTAAGLAEIITYTYNASTGTKRVRNSQIVSDQSPGHGLELSGINVERYAEKTDLIYTATYVSSNNTAISGTVRGNLVKTSIL